MTTTVLLRSWGHEEVVRDASPFTMKILHVHQGKSCDWGMHVLTDRTFLVIQGIVRMRHITNEDYQNLLEENCSEEEIYRLAGVRVLGVGQYFRVPKRMLYQFQAVTDADLVEGASTIPFAEDDDRLYPLGIITTPEEVESLCNEP